MSKKRKRQKERFYEEPKPDYDEQEESLPEPLVLPRRKVRLTQLLDPAKVAALLRASDIPVKEKREPSNYDYPTYTQEEVTWLLRESGYLDEPSDEPDPDSK